MKSIWQANSVIPTFEEMKDDLRVDVLIIGGGLAGIMCARLFDNAGINYAVIEQNRILNGVSANTTAKVTAQHGLIYSDLVKKFNKDYAKLYLKANLEAVEEIRNLSQIIDCDFVDVDSYVYFMDNLKKITDEIDTLQDIGYNPTFDKHISLPFEICGAEIFERQGQFNPLKFGADIAKNLKIYENTKALSVKNSKVITDKGIITADKIIVTTHFPIIDSHGFYFLKMFQSRSYVIAYENAPNVNGIYVDEQDKGFSFRNYKNTLFICGGDHRTGKKGGCYDIITSLKEKYYPEAIEKYRFATQDCMTLDGIPYIGLYSKNTPNIYVATGFNKWGMTNSAVSARVLFDTITKGESEYNELYNPSRSIIKPQLFINGAVAISDFLFPTAKRCTHLGCALRWNKAEKTWDCPCHGSRFNTEGEVLENPAIKNTKI